ncbi:uncharacterized protein LOC103316930 isoform X2 [Nasonia vitripennis]|uniref:Uncharacterized protein n=1 Tax=Nasonia vitripennis TaxID=7425 RepID=A0A7M7Q5E8_NASVI|nr:uncharacterized protein LOC103316930 isoform X2 [Nasonia vitripennis]
MTLSKPDTKSGKRKATMTQEEEETNKKHKLESTTGQPSSESYVEATQSILCLLAKAILRQQKQNKEEWTIVFRSKFHTRKDQKPRKQTPN